MTLSNRIQSCLDDYWNDEADIDKMVEILTEILPVALRAEESIGPIFKKLDASIDRLEETVKVQA